MIRAAMWMAVACACVPGCGDGGGVAMMGTGDGGSTSDGGSTGPEPLGCDGPVAESFTGGVMPPMHGLEVEAVVDTDSAFGLHVRHPRGPWGSQWDCHPDQPNPDWGRPAQPKDDPRWSAAGPVTQSVELGHPEDGTAYRVGVLHTGAQPATVTVRIFIGGQLASLLDPQPLQPGQFWQVADISFPSEAITVIDAVLPGLPGE